MSKLVPGTPVQGALYHRLTTVIAANHSGLGPNNVATASFRRMIGRSFQVPISGSTTQQPSAGTGSPYR